MERGGGPIPLRFPLPLKPKSPNILRERHCRIDTALAPHVQMILVSPEFQDPDGLAGYQLDNPSSGQYGWFDRAPPDQTMLKWRPNMEKKKFVYYEEGGMWVGWLEDFPDYRTQGESLDELEANLKDIYEELTSNRIPSVHRIGELAVG